MGLSAEIRSSLNAGRAGRSVRRCDFLLNCWAAFSNSAHLLIRSDKFPCHFCLRDFLAGGRFSPGLGSVTLSGRCFRCGDVVLGKHRYGALVDTFDIFCRLLFGQLRLGPQIFCGRRSASWTRFILVRERNTARCDCNHPPFPRIEDGNWKFSRHWKVSRKFLGPWESPPDLFHALEKVQQGLSFSLNFSGRQRTICIYAGP
jgi:hypothetical protein